MPYYTYIVRCGDSTLYTGITTDIERRLKEHNGELKGGAKYTKMHQPVSVVYREEYKSRSEATRREYKIKQMTRIEKLNLIQSAL